VSMPGQSAQGRTPRYCATSCIGDLAVAESCFGVVVVWALSVQEPWVAAQIDRIASSNACGFMGDSSRKKYTSGAWSVPRVSGAASWSQCLGGGSADLRFDGEGHVKDRTLKTRGCGTQEKSTAAQSVELVR
jgi:hypothetical protein